MDTDPRSIPLELWERFLAHECTPAEEARVRAWAAEVVGDPAAADRLRGAIQGGLESHSAAPPAVDVRAFLGELRERLALPTPGTHGSIGRTRRRAMRLWRTTDRRMPHLVAVLAAAVAIAAIVLVPTLRLAFPGLLRARAVYVTQRGERSDIRLADGTQVILAPSSRLVVSAGAAAGGRELALTGAALFRVTYDARHPFVVRTAHATTVDVGTAFTVRDYARDTSARIVVREGRVRVAGARDSGGPTIGAGGAAVVGRGGRTELATVSDAATELAWADGRPTFHDARLGDVAADIGRWYDVDVTVADPALADRRVSTSWSTESAPIVLHDLAMLVHARVEWTGARAVLKPVATSVAP